MRSAPEIDTSTAAGASPFPVVRNTVEVHADDPGELEALGPAAHVTQQEILSAAGTFGDFTRYLQVLPGVIWNSDLSNDVLVRGGHPIENLFVVDGVEVPNLNHFSLSGSNGGFTSMIDSSTIDSVDVRAGVYDSGYSSRLSSLIQIHTRQPAESDRAGELTVGISGAGGFYQTRLPHNSTILVSAHRSIVSLVTQDIGLNGVPVYSNALVRLDWNPDDRNTVSLFSLSGNDSIGMRPCPGDYLVSSSVKTDYSGWRTTEALGWSHLFTPHLNSRLTASTSLTSQSIRQEFQSGYVPKNGLSTCQPLPVEPVYREESRDGQSTVNYQIQGDVRGWLISAGVSGRLITPNERVEQPLGEPSPFSLRPEWTDAVLMRREFASGQTAAFLQADGSIGSRWKMLAGLRAETFSIIGRHAVNPRFSIAYRLNKHQSIHVSAGESSQLPPTMDLLSYPQNQALHPIRVRQGAAGMRLVQANWGTLDVEAYEKHYRHEAVSTEYPQLMLSNMIDTLGQWFAWLPLTSGGRATSRGLEVTLRAHTHNRLHMLTSVTYSRTSYRALDGIRRRGNYDYPLVANAIGTVRLPRGFELNLRETYSSGHPYTPYNLTESYTQNRAIYDLTAINGSRGPFYNRLDLEIQKKVRVGKRMLTLHGGADNVLNRHNLLGYVWLPNCDTGSQSVSEQACVRMLPQMGLFPAFAARYQF